MFMPLVLGLLLASADGASEKQVDPADKKLLDEAMECSVYMDLARTVYAQDPVRTQVVAKLRPYWAKRYKDLAVKAGYSSAAIEMRPLVIPLQAERFPSVFLRCLEATPKDAFR